MTAGPPKIRERGGEEQSRPRLGRGLAALLADPGGAPGAGEGLQHRTVPVEFLRPNPKNPRRRIESADLAELADSIRAKGILQPIIVRAIPKVAGSFEIIAGERRWRAAQAAQLTEVPVIVIEADDREALAFAIIENVQRADLNAIEEAMAYERLAQEFSYSQTELSAVIGKSRSHVANTVRLLKLPAVVVDQVVAGLLTAGHARALLACADPEAVARQIVAEGLTVRDVEALAQREVAERAPPAQAAPGRSRAQPSDESRAIAAEFSAALGLTVRHHVRGDTQELRIRLSSSDDLATLRSVFRARGPQPSRR